jgi:hemolysin activation/secretion protein
MAGKNILQVNIQEAPAFQAGIGYDNYRPPSIGSWEGTIFLSHDNLFGLGDRFSGQYWLSEGLNLYDISYEIPINALDGTVKARYWNSNNVVTESFLREFEIENQSENLSFSLRQPIFRSVQNELALDFSFDLRRSRSFLLDEDFCFSSPCQEGKTNLTILRFAQEWLNRSPVEAIALRSRFSLGVAAFDAIVTDFEPNSEFFIWLGEFQYLRQINSHNLLLIRFSAQFTPDGLPIVEQFSLGGIDTVRGYIQNQLVTDNGVFGSAELRVSLTGDPRILQLTPFLEMGMGWNTLFPNPDPNTLASVGLGLRWEIVQGLTARVDYGIPLISVTRQGNSLQENGFYFSIRYQPF